MVVIVGYKPTYRVVALVLTITVFAIGGLAVIAGHVGLNFRRVLGGRRGRPSVKPPFAQKVGAVAASEQG